MPKKKEPPLSAEEQRKRFEDLAREVGASTSARELRKEIGRVAKSEQATGKKKGAS